MKTTIGTLGAALTAAMLITGPANAATKAKCDPDQLVQSGTFEAHVTGVGFLVGVHWGGGVLTLNNGVTHNFSLKGGKVMEIGAAEKKLTGTVYNLEKMEDFPGIYLGVGGGLTVVTAGLGGLSMTNSACVVMNASAEDSKGLQVSMPIAPGGVQIAVEN